MPEEGFRMAQNSPSRAKIDAVVLNHPGAPDTPHQVVGLPGLYRPDTPTPVGGEGEVSLETVKDFIAKFEQDAKDARKAHDEFEQERVEAGLRPAGATAFVVPECPVKLVKVDGGEVDDLREQAIEDRAASANGVAETIRTAVSEDEVDVANDEKAATSGQGA